MKILVDELPYFTYECPFIETCWHYDEKENKQDSYCPIINHNINNECYWFKEVGEQEVENEKNLNTK